MLAFWQIMRTTWDLAGGSITSQQGFARRAVARHWRDGLIDHANQRPGTKAVHYGVSALPAVLGRSIESRQQHCGSSYLVTACREEKHAGRSDHRVD